MASPAGVAASTQQARTSPHRRAQRSRERLEVHGSQWMRLAMPAPRFPAVAYGPVLLPQMVSRRGVGAHPCPVAPAGTRPTRTSLYPQRREHRLPIGENHGKRGPRGYDAGKKVKGRKRHLLVDTTGLLLKVVVHAADIQDRDGGRMLVESLKLEDWPRLKKLWADGAYSGSFEDWLTERTGWTLEIVNKLPGQSSFQPLPRRWVVERTFAWLGKCRRLSKDYEALPRSEETWIYLAMTDLMLARLGQAGEPVAA